MAVISRWLEQYRATYAARGDDSLRVVVALTQPAVGGEGLVGTTAQDRGAALEMLRASGLRGDILRSSGLRPQRIVAGVRTATVQIQASQLEQLAASPGIEYVRPVRWHQMHLNRSLSTLGVNAAVHSRYTGRGVRVAVIDSGIDFEHPDFAGRVNLALSRNFTGQGSQDDVTDHHGHGTHVAGIIGGAGAIYKGVAPEVEFIVCKVFGASGSATEEGALIEAIRWAVQAEADVINFSGGFSPVIDGKPLVDAPWVWPEDLLEEEIEFSNATATGAVAVVSAGNEGRLGDYGTLSVPATSPNVISVAALNPNGQRSSFSSAGPALRSAAVPMQDMVASWTASLEPVIRSPKVDIIAPGGEVDPAAAVAGGCYYVDGIVSSRSGHAAPRVSCAVEPHYEKMSGTSQASPHIAGLAALMLQIAKERGAEWKGEERSKMIRTHLVQGCIPVTGLPVEMQGAGLPNWEKIESELLKELP